MGAGKGKSRRIQTANIKDSKLDPAYPANKAYHKFRDRVVQNLTDLGFVPHVYDETDISSREKFMKNHYVSCSGKLKTFCAYTKLVLAGDSYSSVEKRIQVLDSVAIGKEVWSDHNEIDGYGDPFDYYERAREFSSLKEAVGAANFSAENVSTALEQPLKTPDKDKHINYEEAKEKLLKTFQSMDEYYKLKKQRSEEEKELEKKYLKRNEELEKEFWSNHEYPADTAADLKAKLEGKKKCPMSKKGKCTSDYSPLKCDGINIPDDCIYVLKLEGQND